MADINEKYSGFIETLDFDGVWQSVINQGPPFSIGARAYLDSEDGKAERAKVLKFNSDSAKTVSDVKQPYSGATNLERLAWLKAILSAINSRVALIKSRTEPVIKSLNEDGVSSAGETFLSLFTVAFSAAIPVVGTLIGSLFSGKVQSDKQERINRNADILRKYTSDFQNLKAIENALSDELKALEVTVKNDPTNKAPTPISIWWYVAGFAVLLLLFIYLKKRKKRRKR